ncbi:MAG: hypothetical protein ACLQVW_29515 [Limisphaerales bacterium]
MNAASLLLTAFFCAAVAGSASDAAEPLKEPAVKTPHTASPTAAKGIWTGTRPQPMKKAGRSPNSPVLASRGHTQVPPAAGLGGMTTSSARNSTAALNGSAAKHKP